MNSALDELKTRARVRLNRARREGVAGSLQLADCLHDAARAVGFAHWDHARRVLGGLVLIGVAAIALGLDRGVLAQVSAASTERASQVRAPA